MKRELCNEAIPPINAQQLIDRAEGIAGLTFGELAAINKIPVPNDLKRDKGWVGQLIEWHLGAYAGSRAEPDFPHLGIELKTIPIDHNGKPLETTFVAVAPLVSLHGLTWKNSYVKKKLSHVLWVPIEGIREIPLADRRVGMPFLWSPNTEQAFALQQDWEELVDMIVLGRVESITARMGEYLQIRPKAANSKALTEAYGINGESIKTLPRGFYLKTRFTHQILKDHFDLI
ncbi:DNA mismatch repair endonuclease MutH [Vibrio sp. SS-MA-C1-2]|uniref:DNA mismatch repair endonuclease MutH n=1 Tax=Vibrio sp. SS-MA-C1-2 TaxID=2908646 RepID=UPI001F289E17|nr:DNA mismatch repair endonuclease MutH [Vibrio sp. SS-MA-C1-2]UJF19678.1 DNA mismatch repair endonuclease MutH [Vibrio sp. SS-MA-C1-2]